MGQMARRLLFFMLVLLLPLGAAWAMTSPQNLDGLLFRVWREGSPMGSHSIRLTAEGPRTIAEITIRLDVALGPVTLFRYRHHNREVWENGRLVEIETRTDDDGEQHEVRGRAVPEGFRVEGTGGSFLAPADVMTTSYWQKASVERSELLDTQAGRMIRVTTREAGREQLRLGSRQITATRFETRGDLNLTLWYDDAGRWVKLRFTARGSEIVYEPASS